MVEGVIAIFPVGASAGERMFGEEEDA